MVEYGVIEARVHDAALNDQVWQLLLRRGTDVYEPTYGMMRSMMLIGMKFPKTPGMDGG